MSLLLASNVNGRVAIQHLLERLPQALDATTRTTYHYNRVFYGPVADVKPGLNEKNTCQGSQIPVPLIESEIAGPGQGMMSVGLVCGGLTSARESEAVLTRAK